MHLWGEWKCALMGGGEQSAVNLHSGEQIMPWLCAGNFLVLLQVSLSLLLITLLKVTLNASATSPQPAFPAFEGFYGGGSGRILRVACTGSENRLTECAVSDEPMCHHSQDGGAFCAGMLVDQQLQTCIWLYQ